MSNVHFPSLPSTGWHGSLSHQPVAVLFKHSPICGSSAAALRHVLEFTVTNATVPVYLVDVLRERTLSQDIAQRLGVLHASPQVIVVRRGVPVWEATHAGVTAVALEAAIRPGTAA